MRAATREAGNAGGRYCAFGDGGRRQLQTG